MSSLREFKKGALAMAKDTNSVALRSLCRNAICSTHHGCCLDISLSSCGPG